MLDELQGPLVAQVVEEATDVGIEHPVHPFPLDAHRQRISTTPNVATANAKTALFAFMFFSFSCRMKFDLLQQGNGGFGNRLRVSEAERAGTLRKRTPYRLRPRA